MQQTWCRIPISLISPIISFAVDDRTSSCCCFPSPLGGEGRVRGVLSSTGIGISPMSYTPSDCLLETIPKRLESGCAAPVKQGEERDRSCIRERDTARERDEALRRPPQANADEVFWDSFLVPPELLCACAQVGFSRLLSLLATSFSCWCWEAAGLRSRLQPGLPVRPKYRWHHNPYFIWIFFLTP